MAFLVCLLVVFVEVFGKVLHQLVFKAMLLALDDEVIGSVVGDQYANRPVILGYRVGSPVNNEVFQCLAHRVCSAGFSHGSGCAGDKQQGRGNEPVEDRLDARV